MSRYIVTPILGARGIPYYVVTDTSTGKGLEGYGCDTWAQHRADALNKTEKRTEVLRSRNKLHAIK